MSFSGAAFSLAVDKIINSHIFDNMSCDKVVQDTDSFVFADKRKAQNMIINLFSSLAARRSGSDERHEKTPNLLLPQHILYFFESRCLSEDVCQGPPDSRDGRKPIGGHDSADSEALPFADRLELETDKGMARDLKSKCRFCVRVSQSWICALG